VWPWRQFDLEIIPGGNSATVREQVSTEKVRKRGMVRERRGEEKTNKYLEELKTLAIIILLV
jgi:hypothetical protein